MVPNDNPDRDTARRRVEPLSVARALWLRLCLREDLAGAENRRLMGSPRSTEQHRERRRALEDLVYPDAMARQLEEIRNLPEAAS